MQASSLYIHFKLFLLSQPFSPLPSPLFFKYICTQHQTDRQISFLSSQNIKVLHNIQDVKNNLKCVIFASGYSDISLSISKFNCQPCKREIEHTLVICFLDCQNYNNKKKKERKKMHGAFAISKENLLWLSKYTVLYMLSMLPPFSVYRTFHVFQCQQRSY